MCEEEFLKANFLSTALRVKEITTQINYRKRFNFHKILLNTKKFTISGACKNQHSWALTLREVSGSGHWERWLLDGHSSSTHSNYPTISFSWITKDTDSRTNYDSSLFLSMVNSFSWCLPILVYNNSTLPSTKAKILYSFLASFSVNSTSSLFK